MLTNSPSGRSQNRLAPHSLQKPRRAIIDERYHFNPRDSVSVSADFGAAE
jgi:hypothetical protein